MTMKITMITTTMKVNPTHVDVKVGDTYASSIHTFDGRSWFYVSTVLDMEDVSTRFGREDRIVRVCVRTNEGTIIDHSKMLWVSQLRAGLV